MTGLSKITDKILTEAREDAARTLAAADKRCEEIAAEYAARAAAIRSELNEEARREAAELVARAKSGEAMERRNASLELRGARIDEAFSLAHKELLQLSEERYLELLTRLLLSAVRMQAEQEIVSRELYGEEDAPSYERYEVLLNERDRARFGEALLRGLRERLDQGYARMLGKISLSEQTAGIDGGLILKSGSIELNCSLRALFEEIRPSLEAKVGQRLFPEKSERKGS